MPVDGSDDDGLTMRLFKHYTTAQQSYSYAIGALSTLQDGLSAEASVKVTSRRTRRALRSVVRVGFHLLCQRIVRLEFQAQQASRSWASLPRLSCVLTLANVRSFQDPIFLACWRKDIEGVRYLLESGQASITDVDEYGRGLLEVRLLAI